MACMALLIIALKLVYGIGDLAASYVDRVPRGAGRRRWPNVGPCVLGCAGPRATGIRGRGGCGRWWSSVSLRATTRCPTQNRMCCLGSGVLGML